MSVKVRGVSGGGGGGAALGGAEARLASLVSEALRRSSAGKRDYWDKEDEELGVQVSALAPRKRGSYAYRQVNVSFLDSYVDESGVLVESAVANVGAVVELLSFHVEFSSKRLPSTWRPPRHLVLLPAALNTALSALGAEKILSGEFGVAVGAGAVSVRHMFDAETAGRRPVILLNVNVNGGIFAFNNFRAILYYYSMTSKGKTKRLFLDGGVLVHHGDRKLAMRLYMLAWLKRELEKALEELKKEGYEVEGEVEGEAEYRVTLNGKTVHIVNPDVSDLVKYFDEEYLVLKHWNTGLMLDGRERDLPKTLEVMFKHGLLQVEAESENTLETLIKSARQLLYSEDSREKDLGILLAVLIKRAYEEAEMAVPG